MYGCEQVCSGDLNGSCYALTFFGVSIVIVVAATFFSHNTDDIDMTKYNKPR